MSASNAAPKPTLESTFCGIKCLNPFWLASAPPANCGGTPGQNLTVTGTAVNKENLNVFGLLPTFASITLSSTVTVVEE